MRNLLWKIFVDGQCNKRLSTYEIPLSKADDDLSSYKMIIKNQGVYIPEWEAWVNYISLTYKYLNKVLMSQIAPDKTLFLIMKTLCLAI